MAAIVANKVKRERQNWRANSATNLPESDLPDLYHRNSSKNRSKQLSDEELLKHRQKIMYYKEVI